MTTAPRPGALLTTVFLTIVLLRRLHLTRRIRSAVEKVAQMLAGPSRWEPALDEGNKQKNKQGPVTRFPSASALPRKVLNRPGMGATAHSEDLCRSSAGRARSSRRRFPFGPSKGQEWTNRASRDEIHRTRLARGRTTTSPWHHSWVILGGVCCGPPVGFPSIDPGAGRGRWPPSCPGLMVFRPGIPAFGPRKRADV
jgi:hypothetical protein